MKRMILTGLSLIIVFATTQCVQKNETTNNLNNNTQEQIQPEEKSGSINIEKPDNPYAPKLEIPDWAKPLNLTFPEKMEYLAGKSSRSYYENDKVNSINFVFQGTYEQAMKEAERIAKIMNVPMDENFKIAKQNQKKVKEDMIRSGQSVPPHMPEIKGAIYSNLVADANKLKLLDFRKTIIAEESGKLIIQIINNKHLLEREKNSK